MNRSTFLRAAQAVALTLLASCGGGSSGSTGSADAPLCGDSELGQVGEYMVENNTWNKAGVSGYRQCVSIASAANGGVDVAFEWTWPGPVAGVRSYPEVIYGQKPWYATTTPKLPRIVDNVTTALVAVDFDSTRNGDGNLAFDIWLTDSNVKTGDHLPLAHELMIWLDRWGNMAPAGALVETVSIGDATWQLYITTATWGPEPWQYIAYVPVDAVRRPAVIDVRMFLDHLKQRGSISGAEWLASIELGNEVETGTGSTRLKNFNVTVD